MKALFGIIAILYLSVELHAFNFTLNGKVIDRKTREPIPFSHISLFNGLTGEYSDVEGKFQMKVKETDTLLVSCIGYKTDTLVISPAERFVTIELQQISIKLDEITVEGFKESAKKLNLGYDKRKGVGGYDMILSIPSDPNPEYHSKISTKIKYDDVHIGRIIKRVNLRAEIKESHGKAIYVRIKFYSVNDTSVLGDEPLVQRNLFFLCEPEKRLLSIDIEDERIGLPENGVKLIIDFLGLLDGQNRRINGQVILSSSSTKSEEPLSYLLKKDGRKGLFVEDLKGKYYNIGVWLEI